ncbi:MFS-type drug efflux transporter P55 [Madurella mycetomatis]|uniref:MFS-type drug efflux transporter P55 n=1 Tax=Madurella mycetomatis TaxID=100816 RepID=A0A175VNI7_9PEZI|nr:MFS-type drug efflux transporter P55 [Madurella mycetomatis]
MLIAGHAIQGASSGDIVMIVHIILADLVPLRSREYYLAIILAIYSLGLTLGPFIGALLYFFLYIKYNRETTVI